MKKTQLKDALRTIWKSKVSYLSILMIAMLAVAAYLGITFAANAIKAQASRFYARTSFRDAEVLSTMLLTEDDLDAIRAVDGVADAEGVFASTLTASFGGECLHVTVLSMTERINLPELVDGRMPAAKDECLLEISVFDALRLSIGDRLAVAPVREGQCTYLLDSGFTVVGTIRHPDYYTQPNIIAGNRCMLVLPEAFDAASLDGCYMKAEIRLTDAASLPMMSDDYEKAVKAPIAALEAITEQRAALRDASVRAAAQTEIENSRAELNDAKDTLDSGRAELDAKTAEAADGEQKLIDAKAELEDAKRQLEEAEPQLAEGEAQLADAKALLEDTQVQLDEGAEEIGAAKNRLDAAKQTLISGWNTIESTKTQIRDGLHQTIDELIADDSSQWITWASPMAANPNSSAAASDFWITANLKVLIGESLSDCIAGVLTSMHIPDEVLREVYTQLGGKGEYDRNEALRMLTDRLTIAAAAYQDEYDALADGCSQWDNGHRTYLYGLQQYRSALAQYNEGKAAYEEGLAEYEAGLAEYEEKKAAFEEAKQQYEQGLTDYENGCRELNEGKQKLADGEADYAEGLAAYQDGLAQLDSAKETLATLAPCRWVLLGVNGNGSYVYAKSSAESLSRLGMTFALLFVFVGELVIYATVGRMIEDDRKLIGSVKAQGLFNREIFAKYLLYGVSATLVGAILGVAVGYYVIQRVAVAGYVPFFVCGTILSTFLWLPSVLLTLIGAALSAVAVWFACSKLLRASARELMQESTPPAVPKSVTAGRHLSLYTRLILRNLRTDRRRILITIVSIAGCCTLLMIGFTMRDGISGAIDRQYTALQRYDQAVSFDPSASETVQSALEAVLDAEHLDYGALRSETVYVKANDELELSSLLVGSSDTIGRYYRICEAADGKTPMSLPEHGVLIHKRMMETKHLQVGDTFTLLDGDMRPHTVTVAGVYNAYFGRNLFTSEAGYREIFGSDAEHNTIWVGGCPDNTVLKEKLAAVKGYEYITSLVESRESTQRLASILTLITGVLIIAAGIMAYFILLNLASMALTQKKRELTVMRINGFTTGEVIRYIAGETILTTLLGILLGLLTGGGVGILILRFVETVATQFVRSVTLSGVGLSAAITAGFSFGIHALAFRKVKDLKLTDMG